MIQWFYFIFPTTLIILGSQKVHLIVKLWRTGLGSYAWADGRTYTGEQDSQMLNMLDICRLNFGGWKSPTSWGGRRIRCMVVSSDRLSCNHGSGTWRFWRLNSYSRALFSTSMIYGRKNGQQVFLYKASFKSGNLTGKGTFSYGDGRTYTGCPAQLIHLSVGWGSQRIQADCKTKRDRTKVRLHDIASSLRFWWSPWSEAQTKIKTAKNLAHSLALCRWFLRGCEAWQRSEWTDWANLGKPSSDSPWFRSRRLHLARW